MCSLIITSRLEEPITKVGVAHSLSYLFLDRETVSPDNVVWRAYLRYAKCLHSNFQREYTATMVVLFEDDSKIRIDEGATLHVSPTHGIECALWFKINVTCLARYFSTGQSSGKVCRTICWSFQVRFNRFTWGKVAEKAT